METNKRSVMLSVGHYSKKRGAQNKLLSLSEWQLCSIFVKELASALISNNVRCGILENHRLRQKVNIINNSKPEIAIEFHMNAFDTVVYGHTCMYWNNSFFGEKLATMLNDGIITNTRRPLISVKKSTEKGSYFLRRTRCISVIVELCFIDNDEDLFRTVNNFYELRRGIIIGLQFFFSRYTINNIEKGYHNELSRTV